MSQSSENCSTEVKSRSLEKSFNDALSPIEEFFHNAASSGIVLMICTVAAILIANSALYPLYNNILHTNIIIGGGMLKIEHTLHHWINDGLMVLFFFVVGLEIKREVLVGELADLRQAILPFVAAVGGMVVPALFYVAFNSGEALNGWGIPMATDIAFALGILALLGNKIPKPLIGLLLAIAIVDDLGAVLIIAVFYTEKIYVSGLLFSAICLCLLILANLAGIRKPLFYLILGILLWLGMMKSGVHATLAGVITAMTIPSRSKSDPQSFSHKMYLLVERFQEYCKPGKTIMENIEQQQCLQSMENAVHKMESPLQRMEHGLHIWVSFLIIPLFAFANAGVPIDFSQLDEILLHPVTLGIVAGLLAGKTIGIFGAAYLVTVFKITNLPKGVNLSHIFGISLLAGIGFTMSIFIGSLAFAEQNDLLLKSKVAIVVGSLIAGVCGYLWLRFMPNKVAH